MSLVELKDVTPYWTFGESDAIPDAAWNDADLVGSDQETAELGLDIKSAVLRDDEEVTICGVECFVFCHVFARCVDKVSNTRLHGGVSSASHKMQRMHPIYCLVKVEGIPS